MRINGLPYLLPYSKLGIRKPVLTPTHIKVVSKSTVQKRAHQCVQTMENKRYFWQKTSVKESVQRIIYVGSIICGLLNLGTGVGLIVHGLTSENFGGVLSLLGVGVWCSIFPLLFGLLGIMAYKNDVILITLSILSIVFSGVLIIVAVISIHTSNLFYKDDQNSWWNINMTFLSFQVVAGICQPFSAATWLIIMIKQNYVLPLNKQSFLYFSSKVSFKFLASYLYFTNVA